MKSMEELLELKKQQYAMVDEAWLEALIRTLWKMFQLFCNEVRVQYEGWCVWTRKYGALSGWLHPLELKFPEHLIELFVRYPGLVDYLYPQFSTDPLPQIRDDHYKSVIDLCMGIWQYKQTDGSGKTEHGQCYFPFIMSEYCIIATHASDTEKYALYWQYEYDEPFLGETDLPELLLKGIERRLGEDAFVFEEDDDDCTGEDYALATRRTLMSLHSLFKISQRITHV